MVDGLGAEDFVESGDDLDWLSRFNELVSQVSRRRDGPGTRDRVPSGIGPFSTASGWPAPDDPTTQQCPYGHQPRVPGMAVSQSLAMIELPVPVWSQKMSAGWLPSNVLSFTRLLSGGEVC